MRKPLALLASFLLLTSFASAEIRSIDIKIFGMDWEVCAHAVRVSLKSVSGVDSVDVSLEKGLANVKMKPGNTATLKQLNEAITRNGFTMKDSTATVAGIVVVTDGKAILKVSGSNELLQLVAQPTSLPNPVPEAGKLVLVEGTVPEAGKGKPPDAIRYHSITEERSK